MKQIGIVIICAACIIALDIARADEGETIFKSQGCMSCHKKASTSKENPSLAEIATAYQGQEERLISYLTGGAEAIVWPEKSNRMRHQIEKTKKLSDADLKALADYLVHRQ